MAFAAPLYGWSFTLESFAELYTEVRAVVRPWFPCATPCQLALAVPQVHQVPVDPREFARRLWGDSYFHPDSSGFKRSAPPGGTERTFVQFVLEPLYKIYSQVGRAGGARVCGGGARGARSSQGGLCRAGRHASPPRVLPRAAQIVGEDERSVRAVMNEFGVYLKVRARGGALLVTLRAAFTCPSRRPRTAAIFIRHGRQAAAQRGVHKDFWQRCWRRGHAGAWWVQAAPGTGVPLAAL